jgi:hypothetical protein
MTATPRGLAEFARQGEKERKLIDQLLADDDLMEQMLAAGGAKDGKYGVAMQISRVYGLRLGLRGGCLFDTGIHVSGPHRDSRWSPLPSSEF